MKVVGFNVSRDESKAKLCWLNWIHWQVFPRERFERYYSAICRFPSIKFQFFFFFFFLFLIFLKFFFSILFSGLLQVVNIVRKKCTIETGAHISFFEWPRLFFSQCPQQSTFSVSLRRILLKFLLDDKIVDGSMEEGQFEMVSTFFIFLFFIFFFGPPS